MENDKRIDRARELLGDFSKRTGITESTGNLSRRYLWTDAFAVQALFGLSHILKEEKFKQQALKLIGLVHEHLGKYHPDDSRKGWISGLNEEEAKKHPTIKGLRIGKKLPERKQDESYNSQLEWERDGQYFHYITRWITALLQAGRETGEEQYSIWAHELMQAAGKFLFTRDSRIGLYWKMDTELSRPLVASMGAHDPLEGLICAKNIQQLLPAKGKKLEPLVQQLEHLCEGQNWATSDSLGIGSLLLNTFRTAMLVLEGQKLIPEAKPKKLLEESLFSLRKLSSTFDEYQNPYQRLAFRECGLTLGLRTVYGMKKKFASLNLPVNELGIYLSLAGHIEDFWLLKENQQVATWKDHLDINEVSLACSLIASRCPQAF